MHLLSSLQGRSLIGLLTLRMPHCAATVLPSTNPSRVQRRRYVISDCACHSCSAVLIDQRRCLLDSKCVCSCITKSLLSVLVSWFAGGYSCRLIKPWL